MITIEEIAAQTARDWFTRAPQYRTRDQLALDIQNAITTALDHALHLKFYEVGPKPEETKTLEMRHVNAIELGEQLERLKR